MAAGPGSCCRVNDPRYYRAVESYDVTCKTCHCSQEQPAAAIDARGGKTHCIRCGAAMRIEWREAAHA